jgi:hypothetical protein
VPAAGTRRVSDSSSPTGGRRRLATVDGSSSAVNGDDFDENPPDPVATIESLGALGYSPESAIADLVDNSIAAGATTVDIIFTWVDPENSWCAVVDNGRGMNEATLRQALRIGSADPTELRADTDLGRFGFGLKTASFSQCREVTVWSRPDGDRSSTRSWDLDHVRRSRRWEMYKGAPPSAMPVLREIRHKGSGTIVLWRRLTSVLSDAEDADTTEIRRNFYQRIDVVEKHLSMTFGRFIARHADPLIIRLNRTVIPAWDPFLKENPATQRLPSEKLQIGSSAVRVASFVLPHESKLGEGEFLAAAGPLGWNSQQGFYVYRQDRLIVAGGWLGLGLAQDDVHNLARISVDVPSTLDREWHLDVRKMSVRPPMALRPRLKLIAMATRTRAKAVYRSRGGEVKKKSRSHLIPVWRQVRRHGELTFTINRDHPLVVEILDKLGSARAEGRMFLQLVEDTVPIPMLPTRLKDEPVTPLDMAGEEQLLSLAEAVYSRYLLTMDREHARKRLAITQPFDQYPEVIKNLTEDP